MEYVRVRSMHLGKIATEQFDTENSIVCWIVIMSYPYVYVVLGIVVRLLLGPPCSYMSNIIDACINFSVYRNICDIPFIKYVVRNYLDFDHFRSRHLVILYTYYSIM